MWARSFLFFLCFLFVGCTAQKPVAQAPVYNVTITDNSQMVVGDNNAATVEPTTKTEQVALPDVSTTAKSSGNSLWLFLIGFILGAGATIAGWLVYLRYFKKKAS